MSLKNEWQRWKAELLPSLPPLASLLSSWQS
jgi:hypothetical protein